MATERFLRTCALSRPLLKIPSRLSRHPTLVWPNVSTKLLAYRFLVLPLSQEGHSTCEIKETCNWAPIYCNGSLSWTTESSLITHTNVRKLILSKLKMFGCFVQTTQLGLRSGRRVLRTTAPFSTASRSSSSWVTTGIPTSLRTCSTSSIRRRCTRLDHTKSWTEAFNPLPYSRLANKLNWQLIA